MLLLFPSNPGSVNCTLQQTFFVHRDLVMDPGKVVEFKVPGQ